MIENIEIENYKSIENLQIELGIVTVLIGENGCGKSNILEGIALASASAAEKLDNEFLTSRGIRVTDSKYMRSAFDKKDISKPIRIRLTGADSEAYECLLRNDNQPYSKWRNERKVALSREMLGYINKEFLAYQSGERKGKKTDVSRDKFIGNLIEKIYEDKLKSDTDKLCLNEYLIYSPENSALRSFEKESYILPLGINGEGIFKLLNVMQSSEIEAFNELKDNLRLIGWFKDVRIPTESEFSENTMEIQDRFLDDTLSFFNQKSANEGFLLLVFYLALFLSNKTPKFFAIDNIDTSLNPKLCEKLILVLTMLAKKYNKQVIFTTHNPAILDGMNLNDEDQKLWVISRDRLGKTKASRVKKPMLQEGQSPVKLSEAFLRGSIGGLPKRF